jgi:hypothetical protein
MTDGHDRIGLSQAFDEATAAAGVASIPQDIRAVGLDHQRQASPAGQSGGGPAIGVGVAGKHDIGVKLGSHPLHCPPDARQEEGTIVMLEHLGSVIVPGIIHENAITVAFAGRGLPTGPAVAEPLGPENRSHDRQLMVLRQRGELPAVKRCQRFVTRPWVQIRDREDAHQAVTPWRASSAR